MPAIREVPKIAKWIRWVTRTDNKIYVSLSVGVSQDSCPLKGKR
jgi:hypothetical protein